MYRFCPWVWSSRGQSLRVRVVEFRNNTTRPDQRYCYHIMDTFHHFSSSKFRQQSVTFSILLSATDVLFHPHGVLFLFFFINRLAAPKLHATVITEQAWTVTSFSSAILLKRSGLWVGLHTSRDKCLRLCQRQSLGSKTRHVGDLVRDLVGDPKVLVGSGPVRSGRVALVEFGLYAAHSHQPSESQHSLQLDALIPECNASSHFSEDTGESSISVQELNLSLPTSPVELKPPSRHGIEPRPARILSLLSQHALWAINSVLVH